ncbi:pyrroline-5-carboxylate reductase [Gloeobacter kilaueensis]|uniref:Pyrroline-5-carboxylate reductase n=1 Tax=Gloeobacter kilaueensis (strain ATCC BAA-2537 / CCAP 1431/1 / ULC 316 / JS1) TaxID=1183438 RepID=U5QQX8_GLOK1|nr:pyrroline-5-carboxylate reductase [Gloeobacter kilaueensis]AGY60120.1 pyrroline-5-carboxylate reductase [Gloeobacter kilaueensis JS1]
MKLGIIGGGAMAEAIVAGLVASAAYAPSDILVSDPVAERGDWLTGRYGVASTTDNLAVVGAETLLLAIKPQVFPAVCEQIAAQLQAGLVLSILAGISLSALNGAFPGRAVIRAMPNTPALVRFGITALSRSGAVSESHFQLARTLFGAIGEVVEVPEAAMDAVTGLSGSGPGYFALVVEALIDGGVSAGLPRPTATRLVLATLRGSAELMLQENLHPALLKDRVASPGGTTAAGLGELETRAVRGAFIEAVKAAARRARELSG